MSITKYTAVMNSREIADLVESRHDDVKRSIERLANRGLFQLPPMAEVHNHLGQRVSVYLVGKRDSYIVVAQLCPEFTARLVDRWQELEAQQPVFTVPQTMPEALRLAADLAEQVESQKLLIEESRPAVEFVEQYVDSTGLITFRELCKTLGAKENAMRFFLIEKGIMYRISGKLTPYAHHIDAGRLVVKTGTAENGHTFAASKWTPKGVNWIAGLWGQHQAQLRMNGLEDNA